MSVYMPNFLIIGAAKSGTSALYHYLRQHPEIYMSPRKETHFFGYEGMNPGTKGPGDTIPDAITNLKDYQALFANSRNKLAIGEASPTYIYVPRASLRIKYYVPDVKLIALLRQPADRAFSAYMHVIRDGREPEQDFAKALKQEEKRIANNWGPIWHYKKCGFYFEQLEHYYDTFERFQIRAYLYEDFNNDPVFILKDIYEFLGLQNTKWVPDLAVRPNVSGIPRSQHAQRMMHKLLIESNPIKSISRKVIPFNIRWRITTAVRQWNLKRPILSPLLRQELTELYRDDIKKLEGLIEQDLSHWFT